MSLFLESIKILNGEIVLPELHQKRVNSTFSHFGISGNVNLEEISDGIRLPSEGLFKLRIMYGLDQSYNFEIIPYTSLKISDFLLVENDEIDYTFKSAARKELEVMKSKANGAEIIIVKNSRLTDTSYSNLLFLKDNVWFTPESFLLNGVQRQHLLHSGKIRETDITMGTLKDFSHFKLINAMNDFDDALVYPLSRIRNLS